MALHRLMTHDLGPDESRRAPQSSGRTLCRPPDLQEDPPAVAVPKQWATQRIQVIRGRRRNPWANQARRGFGLEAVGHQIQSLVHESQPVEHHRLDRLADRHRAVLAILPNQLIEERADAQFIIHARHEA